MTVAETAAVWGAAVASLVALSGVAAMAARLIYRAGGDNEWRKTVAARLQSLESGAGVTTSAHTAFSVQLGRLEEKVDGLTQLLQRRRRPSEE